MLSLLIWLIVLVTVFGLVWWIISQIPLPAPMNIVVRVIFGIVALVVLLWFVSATVGGPSLGHVGRLGLVPASAFRGTL